MVNIFQCSLSLSCSDCACIIFWMMESLNSWLCMSWVFNLILYLNGNNRYVTYCWHEFFSSYSLLDFYVIVRLTIIQYKVSIKSEAFLAFRITYLYIYIYIYRNVLDLAVITNQSVYCRSQMQKHYQKINDECLYYS